MTPTSGTLCLLYASSGALITRTATVTAQHGATTYALALYATALLLLVALVREYLACSERRAVAVRAERAARPPLPPYDSAKGVARVELAAACCEAWWSSCGLEHTPTCPTGSKESSAA